MSPRACVFAGGPVETTSLIGLTRSGSAHDPGADGSWSGLPAGYATVDLERPLDEVDLPLDRFRLFRGYAGWGPGQLDGEVEASAWIVVDAHPDDAFSPTPTDLWRAVLRRQSGRLAWLATCPDDISTN
jgi:putative transcriptional regulator